MASLYPPFLNIGSHGAAVLNLQAFLQAKGFAVPEMIRDGDYGEKTGESVKAFQIAMGREGAAVDGNFGPDSREDAKENLGLDFDAIQAAPEEETFWIGPDNPAGENYVP